MGSKTLSGILWNLFIMTLVISKSIFLFLDLDGPMLAICRILSNVLIILICFLPFRGPYIKELEMSKGKEIAGKLKVMTYMTFIILFANFFVGMSGNWSVQMIMYSVMVILYVVFTALQIMIHVKYKDL